MMCFRNLKHNRKKEKNKIKYTYIHIYYIHYNNVIHNH
jgi:hypothetical protein